MVIGLAQIIDTRIHVFEHEISCSWKDYGFPFSETDRVFYNTKNRLMVIASEDLMDNGIWFLHISCSFKNKLPSWKDLKEVKNTFIGEERVAYQVLPKQSEYVNLMPYCLHLWSPIEQ